MSDTLSVSCQERSDTWRLFAEEPFTDGLLYQNKRLFSFLQLGCSQLRTKFRCRHFIFSRRYTRFSIRQGLRSILQLAPASLMTSRRAFSAAWRRLSASCALSDALLHMDCARASVARTCSSISLKSSAARNTRFRTVLPWSPGKERVKLCRSSSLSKDAFVCTAAFPGTRST